ncbi:class I SAM-dependent methyltransferase [Micromonospora cathayae]|uniref:Class I SAM-dependent methyltransferase n=1 Tax=Micromonospora cathayae TaxID=3028804 RepID=A0ABY7ZKG2_9ACTN|nr:class I SAM-dependent methyltransferase [Micromonospora sp. HUAS 3]WDZ83479.1 class I SAM-dependent methyltransferase [Micromonospora sp. HUAS 3]
MGLEPTHTLIAPPPADPGTGALVDREALRRTAFLFQDGVMLAATVRALDALGLLDGGTPPRRPDDNGYLRVAWRCLAAAGWLTGDDSGADWTPAGRAALRHRDRYLAAGEFLARFDRTDPGCWAAPWDGATGDTFTALVDAHLDWRRGLDPTDLAVAHLDGALAVPALLALRGAGRLDSPDGETARLLTALGWLDPAHRWTPWGNAGLAFVDHLGMVGSYLPMLSRLPQLCRGDLVVSPGAGEWHCERQLNVQASAAAHRRYFADADPVFRDIFAGPSRPAFIADMGCGDGSWLAHLHGMFGDDIRYVGIDVSPVALDTAREVLEAAGVRDPILLIGEIGDPAALRGQLAAHGLDMTDGLHIRSFIDHDRTYLGGGPRASVPGLASGAYVAPDGSPLSAVDVEADLVAHLSRWQPHVGRHGMVVIEAHCVAPQVTRRHLGALHSVAFDAYHGLSHQYPVEYQSFLQCCRLAGFEPSGHLERRYPTSRPFVAVSLNRLTPVRPTPRFTPAVRQDTWQPAPETDLTDGVRLHELLYVDGDLNRPRGWAAGATGEVVHDALRAVEARIPQVRPGEAVRVLDYGAGTGLASLELVRALAAHRIEERLAERGATLELHVVDIPTPWFAQGFALLRDVPYTRFHALRDPAGRFRPLSEVTGGLAVDVVVANMVFHLLSGDAMRHAAASIAEVLRPGGVLTFSAPDLDPATRYAVLFHDPNRLLRRYWLAALDSADPDALPPVVRAAVAAVRPATRAEAQRRADRRILPSPRTVASVESALAPHFAGRTRRRTDELLAEESLLTALVPANQSEYLAEVTDPGLRTDLIRYLMSRLVLPELMAGPAGTANGLNIAWTTGRYQRR